MQILRSVKGRNINRLTWQRGRNGFMALLVLSGTTLHAQTPPPPPEPLGAVPQEQAAPVKLSQDDLSDLLAPIALYPDALIALILPASTVPSDVVLAERYLQGNGDPDQVANQPWDDSVKSLTRYPDVLAWMDKNLDWTDSVGEAFSNQPADVMNAVQALRAKAKATGNLVDTPQQKIVQEEPEVIRIVPADPEVIYVPQYDPEVVYVQEYQPALPPLLTFGLGFAVGSWLNYDFDWGNRCFYRGNWNNNGWHNNNWNHNNGGWNNNNNNWNNNGGGNNGGNVNVVNITNNNVNRWQPSASSQQQLARRARNNNGNARFVNTAQPNVNVNGNNQAAANRHRVPWPTNFTTENRPNRQNPKDVTANQHGYRGPGAAQAPDNNVNNARPVNTMPGTPAEVTQKPHNNNNHGNNGAGHGPVTTTDAPNVSGQLGQPGSVAGQPDRHHNNSNRGDGAVKPVEPTPLTSAPATEPAAAPGNNGNNKHHTPRADVPQNAPVVSGQGNALDPTARPKNTAPVDRPEHHVKPAPTPQSVAPQVSAPAPQKVDRAPVQSPAVPQVPQHHTPASQPPAQTPHRADPAPKPTSENRHHAAPAQAQTETAPVSQPQQSHQPTHQQQSHPQQQQSQPHPQQQQSQSHPQQQQAHPQTSAPAQSQAAPNKGNQKSDKKKKDKDNS